MTEDGGEIKILYTLKQGNKDALSSETVHIFPVSRWKIFLIVVPVFIAAAFLSAFFFSIFFLFSIRRVYSWPLDMVAATETA